MRHAPLLLLASTIGCGPKAITDITISGSVFDGPDSIDTVPNAPVEVRTIDGALFDSVTANASGHFEVLSPTGQPIFIVTDGFDHVPTSFTANIGSIDIKVPNRTLWARRAPILDAIAAEFDGCAESATPSIEGEVRLYLGDVEESDELPIVTTAVASIDNGDGTLTTACYLDDTGVSAPEANLTGQTGRFGMFDLTPGPHILDLSYDADGISVDTELIVYVPEGGTVPLYPAFVPIL